MKIAKRGMLMLLGGAALALAIARPADAQRRGGGRSGARAGGFHPGGFPRATAMRSVTRPMPRPGGGFAGGDVVPRPPQPRPEPGPVPRPPNSRPPGPPPRPNPPDPDWHPDDRWDGCCYYPGRAAAFAAGAVTAAAIGSTVYDLPDDCVTTIVDGVTYEHCGDAWYEPQFSGTSTTYVVVKSPN